jgi:hypothetical protein
VKASTSGGENGFERAVWRLSQRSGGPAGI